ncbi:sulfatase-modifying factor protein [Maribrevibacterium harenarium]|uniref:Sulfatase-modifying factor protein n=1 Tax=Maribrevibacterium harenarium TaxID=2589817 RepID=A0A501X5A1_9GAMM|nr:SUMF1/EgtB/PvdO family nonheme iron enzyme [Maribrevibacterium harenarium]TPE55695.1 sulfatase-modifying factor protein [Maribrevibacterium harenarium]
MNQFYDVSKLTIGQHVGVEIDPHVLNYPLSADKSIWVADQGDRSFVLRFFRPDRGELDDFIRTARRYAAVKHPAITPSYPPFYSDLWVFALSAVCGGERLFSFLGKYPEGAPLNVILSVFDPIAKALDQVHQRDYVHGHLDLNSVHVVNGIGVMTGFGSHHWLERITEEDMDRRFMPPEYLKRKQKRTPASDRYMFMRLLVAAFAGESWLDQGSLHDLPDSLPNLSDDAWHAIRNWTRPAERHRPKSLVEVMRLLRASLFETSNKANAKPVKSRVLTAKRRRQLAKGAAYSSAAGVALLATALLWPSAEELPTNKGKKATAKSTPTQTSFDGLPQTLEEALQVGGTAPKVEKVAPATFSMGDLNGVGDDNEYPVRKVLIPKGFYFSKHEVTFAQYDHFARTTGRALPPDNGWGRGQRPVINVSWYDAKAYTAWLSDQTGAEYRLPTEIEWEYSARAGSDTAFWYGNELKPGYSVCDSCGSQWDGVSSAPVGSQVANPFGLFDMHGNVAEWVEDCYHDNYEGAPTTNQVWLSDSCSGRVLRGGSWYDIPAVGRSATRYRADAALKASNWGFRVVRVIPDSQALANSE